jgi:hypothetical protein
MFIMVSVFYIVTSYMKQEEPAVWNNGMDMSEAMVQVP